MTDVETKTPNKRRLSNKVEKKGPASAKKAKITPNKQDKNSTKQNNVQNVKKVKKNSESENGSPKKMKPFVGTSGIAAATEEKQKGAKKVVKQDKEKSDRKKSRKNVFVSLREKINSNEKESVLQSIDDKIKAIQNRGELTKTAKNKLKKLNRLKKIAEGETSDTQKVVANKSQLKTGNEGKKKGIETNKALQLNVGKKGAKIQAKGGSKKANEVNESNKKLKVKTETKQITKNVRQVIKAEESSDDDEESDNELDESEEESGSAEEEEDGAEGESEEDSDEDNEGEAEAVEEEEEEDSDEDDSEEESPPQGEEYNGKVPTKKQNLQESNEKIKNKKMVGKAVNLKDLENNKLIIKNQKRFVVFVGNIPYDTKKPDLIDHFNKCGEIKHIRIPTEKKSSKPRGFAYVEVGNEESYQKCLSMHHTILKGRRINVLYTQGGKKKGEEQKKEIKVKNFKLHAMRKGGKLAGSKKENQKRSFRRAKQYAQKNQGESET